MALTVPEQLSALNTRIAKLEREIAALKAMTVQAEEARRPQPPRPAEVPTWAGPNNPNLGGNYPGAPSDPGGGVVSFGPALKRRPDDPPNTWRDPCGLLRDASGRVIPKRVEEPETRPPRKSFDEDIIDRLQGR